MTVEFDHAFIWVSAGGEEARVLTAFGFNEGARNAHPGQGTACRRFFFANSYLELLWVSDPGEAQSALVQPTHLWERWQGRTRGDCPFGLAFRPKGQLDGALPFSTWEYRPPYLPAPLSLQVAFNANELTEPMLIYLPSGLRPEGDSSAKRTVLTNRAGLQQVTRVSLVSPHADTLSPELTALKGTGLVQLRAGPEHLIELGFDGESRSQQADFRPLLPLIFRW